jgi:hypothetical protein
MTNCALTHQFDGVSGAAAHSWGGATVGETWHDRVGERVGT